MKKIENPCRSVKSVAEKKSYHGIIQCWV